MLKRKLLWTALLGSLVCLCGCGTADLKMAYEPARSPVPLHAAKMPRIFIDRVEDKTPKLFPYPAGPTMLKFDPPPETFLQEALRTELGRLGIAVVQERGQADAVLHATLTMNGFIVNTSTARQSTLSVLLSLALPAGNAIWENTLVGMGTEKATFLTQSVLERAARRALESVMAQIGPAFETQGVVAKIFGTGQAAPGPAPASAPAVATAPTAPAVRSDIDEPPAIRAPRRDKACAVVIGIRRYQHGLPEADFADADAVLMRKYLVDVLGYQDANTATLLNEQATKSGFEKFFESWLPNRVESGADVFVYFSGHGAPNPKTRDAYLVPYDGDPTYLDKTGYPLKRLYAELGKLPAGKVTVVLDSCFSGAGGRSVLAKGARPLMIVSPNEDIPANLAVLSAAGADQISYAYQDKGHGLFTYFFLKGVKAQAGSGALNMKAVFDYAAPQVANIARREYNADQVPLWSGKP